MGSIRVLVTQCHKHSKYSTYVDIMLMMPSGKSSLRENEAIL